MQLITAALTAWFLVRVYMLPYRTKNVKPLNCVPCLSVWCYLIAYFTWDYSEVVFYAFSVGTIGAFVDELYKKLIA